MNHTQYGLCNNRSTIIQLPNFYDDVLSKPENGNECDSIYLDFAKAFYKVEHNIVLQEISNT